MCRLPRRNLFGPSLLLPAAVFVLHVLFVASAAPADPHDARIAQSTASMRDGGEVLRHEGRMNCPPPPPPPPPAAEPLDPPTTSAFADAKKFLAREHFKQDVSPKADVRIAWLGAMFTRRFVIKIEDAAGEAALQSHTLHTPAPDSRIIRELDDRHETKLTDLWCLLKIQPNGEAGALLISSVPNVFYMRDAAGVLGAVDAVWGGAGWEIGASLVDSERMWPAGVRVMSR